MAAAHCSGGDGDDGSDGSCCCCSGTGTEDEDEDGGWSSGGSRSTAEADDPRPAACGVAEAATSFDLLDARRLPDLLDPERLVAVLDGCLGSEYVRGCVVETWDAALSDHLEAIAHLVLYQTPEHAVSQAVYEQLTELSAALRPARDGHGDGHGDGDGDGDGHAAAAPTRADAARVYGTLRTAARSLLTTRVDACCRQNMCRAVGLAVSALRANTRPVFSVENFLVEINEAANFANLYCTGNAKRVCAALEDIYHAVMAGDYHPTGVVVQMAVMEKCIRAALRTLADARATAAQKTAAQRSLLAELDDVCATVRMKNYGCVDDGRADDGGDGGGGGRLAARPAVPASRFVHFTMSPWRAPIRMYHQQSPASVDQLLKNTVRLVEALVSELFKPCLSANRRRRGVRRHPAVHAKQL